MTRAAVVVFIEADPVVDAREAAVIFSQALHRAVGNTLELAMKKGAVNITIHESMEAGMALGNGYLWAALTPKAFPRPEAEDNA